MARSEGFGSNPKLMAQVSCGQTASDTQPGAVPRPLRDKDSRRGWAAAHLGFGIPGSPPPQLPWQRAEATPGTPLAAGGVLLVPGSGARAVAVPGISPIFPLFSPDYFPATSLGGLWGALGALRGHKSTRRGGTQKETVPRSGQDGAERGQAGVSAVFGGAHSVLGVPRWLWCPWGDRDVPNVTVVS